MYYENSSHHFYESIILQYFVVSLNAVLYFDAEQRLRLRFMVCWHRIASPAKHFLVGCCTAVVLVLFYAYHVHFLAFVTFSYSYNMKANVTAGIVSCYSILIVDFVPFCSFTLQ